MNVFAEIKDLVLASVAEMNEVLELTEPLNRAAITVEPPRDKEHGDMATNAALVLGKACQQNPRELAEKLRARLEDDKRIADIGIGRVEVAGPGFLNFYLDKRIWYKFLVAVLYDGTRFGRSKLGRGKKVNVEYVSANPTGPLHIGHTRGAVFGDALANLLKFAGYQVTREYYVNDGGAQVDVLARSVEPYYDEIVGRLYPHYEEAVGVDVRIMEDGKIHQFGDLYTGDYLKPIAEELAKIHGPKFVGGLSPEGLEIFRDFAIERILEIIKADLAALGVKMDRFFHEKSLYDKGQIEEAIEALKQKGLIYQGTLPPPKGKPSDDWEAREQTLFKSTNYGDDVDRPIQKFDGSWTYFAPDIAYHYNKVQRGYDRLINVFGADHGGYVKRIKAVVSALSDEKIDFDIKTIQLVKLLKNGEPYKMSKRAGNVVNLSDLLQQVSVGVVRFTMLTRKNDAPLDFDFDRVLEESKENPVFYVQYAYARVQSLLRKIGEQMIVELKFEDNLFAELSKSAKPIRGARQVKAILDVFFSNLTYEDFSVLEDKNELALIKKLAEWPRLVELAAIHNEPHRIAFYLQELASIFHTLWNAGKENHNLSILRTKNMDCRVARLALLRAFEIVLTSGLRILGVRLINVLK